MSYARCTTLWYSLRHPQQGKLGIPGKELPGVISLSVRSADFNGHPSRITPDLSDVRSGIDYRQR